MIMINGPLKEKIALKQVHEDETLNNLTSVCINLN